MQNRNRKKIIISLAAFIAGLVLLLWLTAPKLLEPEIERRIESYGFEKVDIAGMRLYPNGASVKTIALEYNGRTAMATGIHIQWDEYDPTRITAIDIEQGELPLDFNDLANPLGIQLEFPENNENTMLLPDISITNLDVIILYKDAKALMEGRDILFKQRAEGNIYDFVGGFTGKDALLNGALNTEGIYKSNGMIDITGQVTGTNLDIPDETKSRIENLNANFKMRLNGATLQNIEADYTVNRLSAKGVHLERLSGRVEDAGRDSFHIVLNAFGLDDSARIILDAVGNIESPHIKGEFSFAADDAVRIPAAVDQFQVPGLTGAVALKARYDLTLADIKNASRPESWAGNIQADIKGNSIHYKNIKDLNADIALEYDMAGQLLDSDVSFDMGVPDYKGKLAMRLKEDKTANIIVMQGDVDHITGPGFTVKSDNIEATYHKEDQKTDFTLENFSLSPQGKLQYLPVLTGRLSGNYLKAGADFTFTGRDRADAYTISAKGNYAPDTGILKADYTLEPLRDLKASDVKKMIPGDAVDLEDFSGRISISGKGEYNEKGFISSQKIRLEDIDANLNDLRFLGVNGVMNLKTTPDIVMDSRDIFIGGFDVGGLPLTEGVMAFIYNGRNDRLNVEKMDWSLAGGTVLAPPFSLNTATMDTTLTLQAKNLDLAELMAITPLEGLTATGKVSGEIPLTVKDHKIRIDQGRLEAVNEGEIRYNPEDVPAFLQTENEYMDMVREVLKDYNYDILSLTVNGETGENQSVRIEATGSNPSFFDGRPVNLNLNVEGDLEDILRFNLGTYALPERIKKQMEQFQE